jgi:peptidoglycan hydrolase CwlO-like protein
LRVRFAGLLAAATLAAGLHPAPAVAQTPELDAARQRVGELQQRIESAQATSNALQARLEQLSAELGPAQVELNRLRHEVEATNRGIEEVVVEIDDLRSQIRERARAVYKQGPTRLIDTLLAAENFGDFMRRIVFASRVAQRDERMVLDMRVKQAELEELRASQERLEAEQGDIVQSLRGQRNEVNSTLARHLNVVDGLARDRAEALALIERLEDELGDELGDLRFIAGQGMPITYGEWAGHFLNALGAPTSRNNMVVVVTWQVAEGTQATWNPLATTMQRDTPGSTTFNSHGVQNYVSREQGIDASIRTLRLPNRGYEPILSNLAAGSPPMDTAQAINASMWCRGCAGGYYVTGLIEAVEENYDRYAAR